MQLRISFIYYYMERKEKTTIKNPIILASYTIYVDGLKASYVVLDLKGSALLSSFTLSLFGEKVIKFLKENLI